MKWILVLLGILAVANLGLSKPANGKNPDDDLDGDYDDIDYPEEDDEATAYSSANPMIKSKPLSLTVNMGETVYLPCDAVDADNFVTMWKKDAELLYQDVISAGNTERRYQRFPNRTLQIVNVNPNDTAKYECSIVDTKEIKVVHDLVVRTPSRIRKIYTRSGEKEITIGSVLEIICDASGTPAPKVIWSKGGNRVHNKHGYEGTSITIDHFRRDNAGVYQCMADNGIGDPDTAAIEIKAIHEPVITIQKMTINSEVDYESQLTCIVHALPKATVLWKKGLDIIAPSDRIILEHEGNHHTLLIKSTKKSDFGNYSCYAENKIGKAEKYIVLSGKPAPAQFLGQEFKEDDVVVRWEVESNQPIVEYHLDYRMKDTKQWHTQNPQINNAQGNLYTVEHTLKDLPVGIYETRLRSKNSYGWSPYSRHIVFEKNYSKDHLPPVSETREEPLGITGGSERSLASALLLVVTVTLSSRFV